MRKRFLGLLLAVCMITAFMSVAVSAEDIQINSLRVVGNGSGNWLNGSNWNPEDDVNLMTETSSGVYEITYNNVAAYEGYEFKFVANGTWVDSWGGSSDSENAVFLNYVDNISFDVEQDNSTIKIVFDITNFKYSVGTGAIYKLYVNDVQINGSGTSSKKTPKASDFTFTAPSDLTYDGSGKTATVECSDGISGIGKITVKYYDANGKMVDGVPKDAGTYTVKIDVAEGTDYLAISDLTDSEWKFTINSIKYVVAGDSSLFGASSFGVGWDFTEETGNLMTKTEDGKYQLILSPTQELGKVEFKVGKLTNGVVASDSDYYGNNSSNMRINVSGAGDILIVFDPTTCEISVSGDNVSVIDTIQIDSLRVVGNGSGNWLNGSNWDPEDDVNLMTETSSGVYEITYNNVAAYKGYEFKFAINGNWVDSWGGSIDSENAVFSNSADNISFDVEQDNSTVKIVLDITNFKYSTRTGAVYKVYVNGVQINGSGTSSQKPTTASGVVGDVDNDGEVLVNDASLVLAKVLEAEVILPVEVVKDYMQYADVNKDNYLTSVDSAMILKKALNASFEF